jgi:hypothetical protein
MRIAFPVLLACAACNLSPAADAGSSGGAASAETRTFSSQADEPSPNYAAMRKRARPAAYLGTLERKARAPLPPDAKAVGHVWIDRLTAKGALGVYGLAGKGPDGPVTMIDTLLSAREFDAWVKDNGWTVPRHIRWSFQPELPFPAITTAAADRVRLWPAATIRTGVLPMVAIFGRVTLRDGCFFVRKFDGPEGLAWFLAETGLTVDRQGYLVLIDRATGEVKARVGETLVWAGLNAGPAPARTVDLRKTCGEHPVFNVGNAEAKEKFLTMYPHLREPVSPAPAPPKQP